MTPQEFFDVTVLHLWRQGGPAIEDTRDYGPRCVYLRPDGRKCAAGYWVDPEKYIAKMEGGSLDNTRVRRLIPEAQHHVDLLMSLQLAHDESVYEKDKWATSNEYKLSIRVSLQNAAKKHGLSDDLVNHLWSQWA